MESKENRPRYLPLFKGTALIGCEPLPEEHTIMIWGGDSHRREVGVPLLLSLIEVKKIAKRLLNQTASLIKITRRGGIS
jgi:hypothetical protein